MEFDIIDEIKEIETITQGSGIRDFTRLKKYYGLGNWKKMKGIAHIRLSSGKIKLAELHWYEAHGIGKKEIKRKRYLE
jgi:nucleotidyltransferase/DNA polymerase involved in DNA repair